MFFPNLKIFTNNKKYFRSISQTIDNKKMSFGPKCKFLEKKLKKHLSVKYAILTTSGTNALMMAALSTKIKKDDKVLCSNAAWVAATNPFLIMGAKIIVSDTKKNSEIVDFDSLNKKIIQEKPKVVILVHLNGQPNYNEKFHKLKKKYKFFVIEDAAQAFLSKHNNKFCGTKYEIGCYSLSIAKPIHMVYGGLCVTNNKYLANRLIAARNNGMFTKNEKNALATTTGLNLKPSDIHASIGLENFRNYKKIKKTLIQNSKIYEKKIFNNKIKFLKPEGKEAIPNFAQVLVKNRSHFMKYCIKNKIGVSKGLRGLVETGLIKSKKTQNLKNSNDLSKRIVRIPFGSGYQKNEILKITEVLNKY